MIVSDNRCVSRQLICLFSSLLMYATNFFKFSFASARSKLASSVENAVRRTERTSSEWGIAGRLLRVW